MSSSELDSHGQPRNRAYNAGRLAERAVDELIGLCRGVLGDGAVTESEANLLVQWMETNRGAAEIWPANQLYRRLREMLVDHVLDLDEQGELLDLLLSITGGEIPIQEQVNSLSATLPLTIPPPEVVFDRRRFCLTGRFAFGTRKQCEAQIVERGGLMQSDAARDTSYLVVGAMGSTDWIHSTYGRKIEAAVALRDRGFPIDLISEEHWVGALSGPRR